MPRVGGDAGDGSIIEGRWHRGIVADRGFDRGGPRIAATRASLAPSPIAGYRARRRARRMRQSRDTTCVISVGSSAIDIERAGFPLVGAAPSGAGLSPEIQWSMKRARQRSSGSEQASRLPKIR